MSGIHQGAVIVLIVGIPVFSRHVQYPVYLPSSLAGATRLAYGFDTHWLIARDTANFYDDDFDLEFPGGMVKKDDECFLQGAVHAALATLTMLSEGEVW